MRERLLSLKNEALALIIGAKSKDEIEDLRIAFLGKKGKLNQLLRLIPALPPEEKRNVGLLANEIKKTIKEAISTQKNSLLNKPQKIIDVTIPGKRPPLGHLHLVTYAIWEIEEIFKEIGFTRASYPEVETDWYAFEALNMPKDHPARDEWETFFIETDDPEKLGSIVLTPHTSSGQVREMERLKKPPIRMINISKCYRRQSDLSHSQMFHQFEGLVIDKGISLVHLKGTIDYFVKSFFGEKRKSRLRPFHFRFTEPSLEIDVSCSVCNGKGCRLCKGGWLELGGAGMVHPSVLKNGGIDPNVYTGFAFGWGVERTYMMKEGLKLDDIRILYKNDLSFLEQF